MKHLKFGRPKMAVLAIVLTALGANVVHFAYKANSYDYDETSGHFQVVLISIANTNSLSDALESINSEFNFKRSSRHINHLIHSGYLKLSFSTNSADPSDIRNELIQTYGHEFETIKVIHAQET